MPYLVMGYAQGTGAPATDPNWGDVVLLVKADGANGTTANITDLSSSAHALTVAGTAQISTTQSKFGGSSLYTANPAADVVYTGQSSDFAFGTGDFTLEAWVYRQSDVRPYSRVIHGGDYWSTNDSWNILFDDGANPNKIAFAVFKLGGRILVSTTSVVSGQWYHIAVTRESGVFRLFVDGNLEDTDSTHVGTEFESGTTNRISLGAVYNKFNEEGSNAYYDEIRITKGLARYTTSFTPQTETFPTS